MKKKLNILNVLYIFLMLVTIFLVAISNVNSLISSFSYSLFLLIISLLFLFFSNYKNNKITTKEILLLFIILAFLFVSLMLTDGGLGSVFFIFIMLLILIGGPKINVDYKCIVYTFIFSFMILIYQFSHPYDSINPNDAANNVFIIYLLVTICFNYIYDKLFNNAVKKKKFIKYVIDFLMLLVVILNTSKYDSRNILLCSILFFVLSFLPLEYQNKKTKKWSNIITILLSFGSLFFVFIYLYMYHNNFSLDLSFISNKKLYSGREAIWDYLFNLFKDDRYIFGIGSELGLYHNMGAHNYMYSVLILFGIPNFLLFFVLLKQYFSNIISKLTFNNRIVYAAIISLFISGFFETSFISSINLSTLLLLSIIFNSIYYMDKENDNIEKET